MFTSFSSLSRGTWQAFERALCRLLVLQGFKGIRIVGQTGDRGADLIAHRFEKRYLFQAKHWKQPVGAAAVNETVSALGHYSAEVPVIVSLNGFEEAVANRQQELMGQGILLQRWSGADLERFGLKLDPAGLPLIELRPYQEEAVKTVVNQALFGSERKALVVMATGLGKTWVAGESIRRSRSSSPGRVLVLAHTNPLLYQLERSFWPFLKPSETTAVWNQYERPGNSPLEQPDFLFASLQTVFNHLEQGRQLHGFSYVLVDECHHAGAQMYNRVLEELNAGVDGGPMLLGLTATPWRADEADLEEIFGKPLVAIDMVTGLKQGFLANVDYRMYTDNIRWDAMPPISGERLSPKKINRTLFIKEWDDGVIREFQAVWKEVARPRALIFCGNIDHAITMRDRINALGFCRAAAIYSETSTGPGMTAYERNRILCDFSDGRIDVVCAVDIFNEGVDVPDVNIIVFQRVTHSRRIFIQQLGRGLRIAKDKDRVVVLDFVSDIRRFAAGLSLKDQLSPTGAPKMVSIKHQVTFRKVGSDDPHSENFLREWLEDVATIEDSGEDDFVLKFPPKFPGAK